jgi:hypothetical protein
MPTQEEQKVADSDLFTFEVNGLVLKDLFTIMDIALKAGGIHSISSVQRVYEIFSKPSKK